MKVINDACIVLLLYWKRKTTGRSIQMDEFSFFLYVEKKLR